MYARIFMNSNNPMVNSSSHTTRDLHNTVRVMLAVAELSMRATTSTKVWSKLHNHHSGELHATSDEKKTLVAT